MDGALWVALAVVGLLVVVGLLAAAGRPVERLAAGPADPPPGSYQKSCLGCSMDGDVLECDKCKTNHKTYSSRSSIDTKLCKDGKINNFGGKLVCASTAPVSSLDTYQHSCGGCSTDGKKLECQACDSGSGPPFGPSSLADRGKCKYGIQNVGGQLMCQNSPPSSPLDTYQKKCEGCWQAGDRLTCQRCPLGQTTVLGTPLTNRSSIDTGKCKYGIQNYFGTLACRPKGSG